MSKQKDKGRIANGERVTWTSSANGTTKKKTGIVRQYVAHRAHYIVDVDGTTRQYTPTQQILERANPKAKRVPA